MDEHKRTRTTLEAKTGYVKPRNSGKTEPNSKQENLSDILHEFTRRLAVDLIGIVEDVSKKNEIEDYRDKRMLLDISMGRAFWDVLNLLASLDQDDRSNLVYYMETGWIDPKLSNRVEDGIKTYIGLNHTQTLAITKEAVRSTLRKAVQDSVEEIKRYEMVISETSQGIREPQTDNKPEEVEVVENDPDQSFQIDLDHDIGQENLEINLDDLNLDDIFSDLFQTGPDEFVPEENLLDTNPDTTGSQETTSHERKTDLPEPEVEIQLEETDEPPNRGVDEVVRLDIISMMETAYEYITRELGKYGLVIPRIRMLTVDQLEREDWIIRFSGEIGLAPRDLALLLKHHPYKDVIIDDSSKLFIPDLNLQSSMLRGLVNRLSVRVSNRKHKR